MKIAIGADHGGYELKESIKKHLEEVGGYEITDYGTHSTDSVDYAEIAFKVGNAVTKSDEKILGILCCGTGIGISMAANKVKGVRAACCSDYFSAKFTRLHNDAWAAELLVRDLPTRWSMFSSTPSLRADVIRDVLTKSRRLKTVHFNLRRYKYVNSNHHQSSSYPA